MTVPSPVKATVDVPGVKVPEFANGVPVPVRISVLAPGAKMCEPAIETEVALAFAPRLICGVEEPVDRGDPCL